jgi:hypothetical protein
LEMCNIIKNDMNTAKLIYKYQKWVSYTFEIK